MISMSVLICMSVLIDSKVSLAGNIVLSFLSLVDFVQCFAPVKGSINVS